MAQLANNYSSITSTTKDWWYCPTTSEVITTTVSISNDEKIRELERRISVLENHINEMQIIQDQVYTIVLGE